MTNDFDNWEDYSDDYEDSQTRGNIPQITEGVQLSSLTEAMNAKQCNGNKKKNGK